MLENLDSTLQYAKRFGQRALLCTTLFAAPAAAVACSPERQTPPTPAPKELRIFPKLTSTTPNQNIAHVNEIKSIMGDYTSDPQFFQWMDLIGYNPDFGKGLLLVEEETFDPTSEAVKDTGFFGSRDYYLRLFFRNPVSRISYDLLIAQGLDKEGRVAKRWTNFYSSKEGKVLTSEESYQRAFLLDEPELRKVAPNILPNLPREWEVSRRFRDTLVGHKLNIQEDHSRVDNIQLAYSLGVNVDSIFYYVGNYTKKELYPGAIKIMFDYWPKLENPPKR